MKRICIITINGNSNFGNKLQNYALTKVVNKFGFKVTTVWNVSTKFYLKEFFKKFVLFSKKINRQKKFIRFNKRFLSLKYSFQNPNKLGEKFDYFIVGSDQVWNYSFNIDYYTLFLEFSPKEKNISYAASFGVDSIPKHLNETYCKGLMNFKKISVREDKGKEIIESITKRKDVEVLIDPTLLLNKKEWEKIIVRPKKTFENKKFILNYFLGELSLDKKKSIENFANDNNCLIINILDKNDPFYVCGPSEFLWLEKNAFLICTDSFHSSIFALIFDKPFVIFDRDDTEKNMSSRIDSLINLFELKNRRYNGKNITPENISHDYSKAYKILKEEKTKSLNFLRNALKH